MSNPPVPSRARSLAYQARCAVTGGGGEFLERRRRYHERRAEIERVFLAEAAVSEGMVEPTCCPVCGSDTPVVSFVNPVGFSFKTCRVDGTVYMDPVPTEPSLDRLYNTDAGTMEFVAGSGQEANTESMYRAERDALTRMAGANEPGTRLLDVGCATGGFLDVLADRFDVSGVELNATTAEIARQRGHAMTTGTIGDVERADGFDVITALQLIEHLPQPRVLFAEAHRLLVPGGLLYVSTPKIDSASFSYLGSRHVHVSSFGHVCLFGRQGLTDIAEGFEPIAYEEFGGRDLALHDILTLRLAPDRFFHRASLYRSRLLYATEVVDNLTRLSDRFVPDGGESYQRVLFRRRG